MKEQLEKLNQLVEKGLDIEIFYSVRFDGQIHLQGKLTFSNKQHCESFFGCKFELASQWVSAKVNDITITLTY